MWKRLVALGYGSVVLATLAAMFAEQFWLLELFSHFRVQYVALILLLLAILASFGRWLLAAALLPLLALNVAPLLPYLTAPTEIAVDGGTLTLASINLLASNDNGDRLLAAVSAEKPDLIVLQEFTPEWAQRIAPLTQRYRYRVLVPRSDNFGIALLSVYPLARQETLELLGRGDPAIHAVLQVGTQQLNVIGVHPVPPTSAARARQRNGQLQAIAGLVARVERPLVVLGDFNTTAWSPYFQQLLAAGGLRNAAEGFGLEFTWPTTMPLLGIAIDHCLIGGELTVVSQHRGGAIGSDHYPLFTQVAL